MIESNSPANRIELTRERFPVMGDPSLCRAKVRRVAALGMCLLLAAACGASDETVDEPTPSRTTATGAAGQTFSASTGSSSMTTWPSTLVTSTLAPTTTGAPTAGDTIETAIVLEPNGLRLVDFGDLFEDAMTKLQAVLGPPTFAEHTESDSPSKTDFEAHWEHAGLRVGFSTEFSLFRDDGRLHFTWWTTDGFPPIPLTTAAGVGVGSTLRQLEDIYGDRFWINSDECAPPGSIAPADPSSGPSTGDLHPRWIDVIWVGFDQPERWSDDGTRYFDQPELTRVQSMGAGASDGC